MLTALAQIASTGDPAENLRRVRAAVRDAAARGARLVVLPEAAMCAFGAPLAPVAEPLDGPWATGVREAAAEAGVTAVVGMFTPGDGGRVRNTLLVTGGGVEASYDKVHLFDALGSRESASVVPGGELLVVEVDGVGVGLATCYDLRFPGLFLALADRGAQLVAVPASWGAGPGKRAQWDLLVRARALDSTSFVAACDQADPASAGTRAVPGAPTGIGASLVASPLGEVLDQLGPGPGALVVDVPTAQVDEVRRVLPVLANRRW